MNFLKTATLIASAADLLTAAPSFAEEGASAASAEVSTRGNSERSADSSKAKYCVTLERATESRIRSRECRTKAEWELLGVDLSSTK